MKPLFLLATAASVWLLADSPHAMERLTSIKPPANIGDTPPLTLRCTKDGRWPREKCPGYLISPDNSQAYRVLRAMEFSKPSNAPSPYADMSIASIDISERFKFRDLERNEQYVLARIKKRPTTPKDPIYGIGGWSESEGYGDDFYIVAQGYAPEPEGTDSQGRGARVRISTYKIYGIQKLNDDSTVKEVGKSGTIRWCVHPHKGRKGQADFIGCNLAGSAAMLSQSRSAMQTLRTFARSRAMVGLEGFEPDELGWIVRASAAYVSSLPSSPVDSSADLALMREIHQAYQTLGLAWFTCGVGCCIAEPDV